MSNAFSSEGAKIPYHDAVNVTYTYVDHSKAPEKVGQDKESHWRSLGYIKKCGGNVDAIFEHAMLLDEALS